MKILHVVTLVSPDNAYGGPLRVAVNQARALIELGHDVTVVAGARGYDDLDEIRIAGVRIQGFPVKSISKHFGFAGLHSPALRGWLQERLSTFDVVHIHFARDMVAIPAARAARNSRRPYVLQTHGMVDRSDKLLAKILDVLITTRLLTSAQRVFYLTELERSELRAIAPNSQLERLVNGVPRVAESAQVMQSAFRADVEVLFLARLHARKNPLLFVRAAAKLSHKHPDVQFTLVGPDEGEGSAIAAAIRNKPRLRLEAPASPDESLNRIASCSIYVLPSVDEPFPMSVLEAMSVGKPVIVTESCGLAPDIAKFGAGVVIEPSESSLAGALDRLLRNPVLADAAGRKGLALAQNKYSMVAISDRLAAAYQDVLSK